MKILTIILILIICCSAHAAVPRPYTPVQATTTQFACLNRSTTLGAALLPTQIKSGGHLLLDSPVRLACTALSGLSGKGRVVKTPESAKYAWTGQNSSFTITAQMTADCDGFCWYDITLTPKQPVELDSLRLEIPLRKEIARYLHSSNLTWTDQVSRGIPEMGGKWDKKFMPYAWLGNEERGLAWCCESDENLRLNNSDKALQVRTTGGKVIFSTILLDHKQTITSPIKLKFGLLATPIKPTSFEWRKNARIYHDIYYNAMKPDKDGVILLDTLKDAGVRTVVYHDQWTDFFGRLVTPYDADLRQLIAECHKRNMKLLVYMGYGLARNAPEMAGHHDEWSVMPIIPWEPGYKAFYRTFDATCARSGWRDWFVKGIDKLFTDYNLDGLYFDGTSEGFWCQNELHGCGWRDAKGELHKTSPFLAVRDLMRRTAAAAHKHRPNAILDVHMSANLTLQTLSFCDSYWDGEQFEGYTTKDKVEIPLDSFRAEFMGYAHGLDAEFLAYVNRPFTINEAITLAWLHGVEVRPETVEQLSEVSPIWQAMDRFDSTHAQWLPYWKDNGVTSNNPNVKASAYVKKGTALLFVSHLKREQASATLTLDRKKLSLPPGDLTATDALTMQTVALTGNKLDFDFDGMMYRIVQVKAD